MDQDRPLRGATGLVDTRPAKALPVGQDHVLAVEGVPVNDVGLEVGLGDHAALIRNRMRPSLFIPFGGGRPSVQFDSPGMTTVGSRDASSIRYSPTRPAQAHNRAGRKTV